MSETGLDLSQDRLQSQEEELQLQAPAFQSAGAQLASARLNAGLTVQQVAEQLKLSSRQIAALEGNQFDVLPKMVIVRGFVRSYAKLLKINAAPVLEALPVESLVDTADLRPTLATPFSESRMPVIGRADAINRNYLYGALVLAVLAGLFYLAQKVEHSAYLASVKEMLFHAPAAGVQRVQPAVVESASAGPAIVAAEPVTVPEPAVPLAPANPEAAPVAQDTLAAGANTLRLKFRQNSWLQIRRENGTIVTAHMAKAGTEESFDVREALQVKIGNASGVEGWLRGVAIPIAPGKESNVINLDVK